jgi:hypothetical protein
MTEILSWPDNVCPVEAYFSPHRKFWVFVDVSEGGVVDLISAWVEVRKTSDDQGNEMLEQYALRHDLNDNHLWVVDGGAWLWLEDHYQADLMVLRAGTYGGEVLSGQEAVDWLARLYS